VSRAAARQPLIYHLYDGCFPLIGQPVREENLKLGMYQAPVPPPAGPFFRDVDHRQIF